MLFQKKDEVALCTLQSPEYFISRLADLNISPVCSVHGKESLGGGIANPQLVLMTSVVFLLTFLGQTHMASKTQRMLEKMETDALIDGINIFTFGQLNRDQIKEKLAYILGDTEFTMEDTEIVQKLTIACAKGEQFQPNLLAVTNYMTSNVLCDASTKITSLKNTASFSIGSILVSSSTIAFVLHILLYYFTGNEKYKEQANTLKPTPPHKGGKKNGRKTGKKTGRKGGRKSRHQSGRNNKKINITKRNLKR